MDFFQTSLIIQAMVISDIIKKTKGELTTTNKPVKVFNNLLGAFEEWKYNWQSNLGIIT